MAQIGLLILVGIVVNNGIVLIYKVYQLRLAGLDRTEALKTVHGYLDDIGIAYCGRYGDWGYMWTDESFISGERAAQSALSRCFA